jgi:hypothetical protein
MAHDQKMLPACTGCSSCKNGEHMSRLAFFLYLVALVAVNQLGAMELAGVNPINGGTWMKCDGVTNDTEGLQTAIDVAANATLVLPKGKCIIARTIAVTNRLHIAGAGGGASESIAGTTLKWAGPPGIPLFDLQGIRDSIFEDFLIAANSSHPLAIGIRSITISGKTSNANAFRHIYMNGTTTGLGKGFVFVAGSGGDNNNDENSFDGISINNYTVAAWSFEHSQSKAHRLINCAFNAASGETDQYGVTTALGPGSQGGSFLWYGGNGHGNAGADFYLGSPNDVILISGGNFEGSARLLETAGASANPFPVTIQGVRWSGDGLAADGKAIIYTQQGPLNLIGNVIGEYPKKPLQIYINDWATPIVATAIGNNLRTALEAPFRGNGTWELIGNIRNFGPGVQIPNQSSSSLNEK